MPKTKPKTPSRKPSTTRDLAEPSATANAELVVVHESSGPLTAEVVKGKLESEGIEAMLKYETAESVFPVTVDGLGKVQVLVHAEDEKRAREVLKA